ncbi:YdcF family protein [Neobacillus niacini]
MILYFAFLHSLIRDHTTIKVPLDADYLIILGARVKGEIPSLSLQYRIDAAADYMKNNKETIAIASGGQGPGEDISEAEAIKAGLLAHGISSNRIILEDRSTDTVENIRFSKKLIPDHLETGLAVTNDFHLYRAKLIAKDQGLNLQGLPAETPLVAIPKSYLREYLAITKYYLVTLFN